MKRPIPVIAATALATMSIAGIAGGPTAQAVATPPARPSLSPLAGSTVPYAISGRATGAVPDAQRLTIEVWLKPQAAAAESYADQVSRPGSPLFQQYLSPAAYTARFGPSAAAAASVGAFLTSQGFTGVAADAGRDYVQGTGTVAAIDAAFRVRLTYYRPTSQANAGSQPLRANDRAVTLPSSIAGYVDGVTGLSNAAPQPAMVRGGAPAPLALATAGKPAPLPGCSTFYGQHVATGLPKAFGTTSFPTGLCGYSASQVRGAYGYSASNAGKGVTIALVEQGLAPDMFKTLQDYAAVNHIQAPSASRYAELNLDSKPGCGDPFIGEEQLDVEAAYDMAPLANELVVGGDACSDVDSGVQALLDADLAILNGKGGHPLAPVASNSWAFFGEADVPSSILQLEHSTLVRAASEGVSMLFASGDAPGVQTPSDDPYATAVGGTTLGIGSKGNRLFETGWADDVSILAGKAWQGLGELFAAGGGLSLLWAQPSYQRGVVPASMATPLGDRAGLVRVVPDISALADPDTGFAFGQLTPNSKGVLTFSEKAIGGTSLATPLVAGLVADAEQGQRHSFGFLNPALYRLAGTSALNDALPITTQTPAAFHWVVCNTFGAPQLHAFDVQSPSVQGYLGQVTLKGYDTMTGIGAPNGQNFISALRKLEG
jgi:subtilase family serine protease